MYLTTTRPDIMFVVSFISRFMELPNNTHWKVGKRILRYIAGTTNFGIQYTPNSNFKLIGYTDSDFAGSIDDRKSTSSYVFSFGSGSVAWESKKQPIVTLSRAEAEYVAATYCASGDDSVGMICFFDSHATDPDPKLSTYPYVLIL